MQALHIQAPRLALQAARPARRPARSRPSLGPPAASADGLDWLSQQAGAVEAEAEAEAAAAAAEAADDSLARSVGLHLRGRSSFKEGLTDEEDPARFVYHKALKSAALAGNWSEAESVVEDMARAGNVPGPRAYHALVCAYVQAGNAPGALGAIRRCWDAGITPLPQTYAAVVTAAVGAGDLDTAEAVVASNRRAGVDCTRSWQQLVIALFQAGQAEKGTEVLSQGQAEGLQVSEAVYEALIRYFCSVQDLASAGRVLRRMEELGTRPGVQHYSALIIAQAEHGDPQAAFALLQELNQQGGFPESMLGVCHIVLEAQLRAAQSPPEVAQHVLRMKGLMLGHMMQPGPPFFSAQLKAALRLNDLQSALQAFQALRQRNALVLQGLDDDQLAALLLGVSRANMPALLHDVLAVMCREERDMPAAAMALDEQGCTILGAWVKRRMDQTFGLQPGLSVEQGAQGDDNSAPVPRSPLVKDGVQFDPQTLFCLDSSGSPLAISRMGVRELRAELAVRKVPVSGNKKELAKRLQKLRQASEARFSLSLGKAESKSDSRRKVMVVVTDILYENGKLVSETRYESEGEVEAAQEEEGEDIAEWDMEEEEGGASSRRMAGGLDDELMFDDELEAPSSDSLAGERLYFLPSMASFTSPQASADDAALMALAAIADLHAAPSTADLQALAAWACASPGAARAAVRLVAALDTLEGGPLVGQVAGVAEIRQQLAEYCGGLGVDVEAAVAVVLGKDKEDDPLRAAAEAEMELLARG